MNSKTLYIFLMLYIITGAVAAVVLNASYEHLFTYMIGGVLLAFVLKKGGF